MRTQRVTGQAGLGARALPGAGGPGELDDAVAGLEVDVGSTAPEEAAVAVAGEHPAGKGALAARAAGRRRHREEFRVEHRQEQQIRG